MLISHFFYVRFRQRLTVEFEKLGSLRLEHNKFQEDPEYFPVSQKSWFLMISFFKLLMLNSAHGYQLMCYKTLKQNNRLLVKLQLIRPTYFSSYTINNCVKIKKTDGFCCRNVRCAMATLKPRSGKEYHKIDRLSLQPCDQVNQVLVVEYTTTTK